MPQLDELRKGQQNLERRLNREQRVYFWGSLFFSFCLVIATGALAYYADKQLSVLNDSRQQTIEALTLAKRQTSAMEVQAAAASSTAVAAEKSAKAASEAATTGRQSLQISERAYVGVIRAELAEPIADGKRYKFIAEVENTGRTPARNVKVAAISGVQPDLQTFIAKARRAVAAGPPPDKFSVVILYPGVSFKPDHAPSEVITASQIAAIQSGQKGLFFYVQFSYTNIFDSKHDGEACFYLPRVDENKLVGCPGYARAD